jgi:hypothetical protein
MVAEIDRNNMNGLLPPAAWEWFYLDHHEKINPPSPYSDLAITVELTKKKQPMGPT